jgi:hypothetical protein
MVGHPVSSPAPAFERSENAGAGALTGRKVAGSTPASGFKFFLFCVNVYFALEGI